MGLNKFNPEHMGMAIVPRPFPGKYPTRILIKLGDYSYLGKPVDAAFKYTETFFKKGIEPRYIDIFEFDLGGLIFLKAAGSIGIAGLAPFYFPFPDNRFLERLSHFGRYWFLRDRQLSKAGGHSVYLSNMFMEGPFKPIYLGRVEDNARGDIPGRALPPGANFANFELWADEYLQPFWRRHIGDRSILRMPAPEVRGTGHPRRTLTFDAPRLDFTPPPPAQTTQATDGTTHYIEWLDTQTAQRRARQAEAQATPPAPADPWFNANQMQFAQQLAGAPQAIDTPENPQAINPLDPATTIRLNQILERHPYTHNIQLGGNVYHLNRLTGQWSLNE